MFDVFRLEHQKMHEKHKGHESMHAEMIIILLLTLIVAQIALFEWKKRHYKSYSVMQFKSNGNNEFILIFRFSIVDFFFILQLITLMWLWIIPIVLCVKNIWWRFIISWVIFSLLTGLVMRRAMMKPVSGTTPR